MEKGIKNSLEITVTENMSAAIMKSGSLKVLATPAMIALIEETAWKSVQPFLENGQSTVGTCLNINHVAPTPIGMKVRCDTELIEVNGRKLIFDVKVYDECGLIGNGSHERFVISAEKFQTKADNKRG
ncbi:MAG: thioesterase family protein [Prevotella sp.]|nr:thioesterase family protein [Prevotella sp.]